MYETDELYHHGIKGQKWGVRRFQTRDGSYTALGARRRTGTFEPTAAGKRNDPHAEKKEILECGQKR